MWLSLQGKDHTEMSPSDSLLPSVCKVMEEFVDVESLIGTAGPLLLQLSTFTNRTKGVSSPAISSEKISSPTNDMSIHTFNCCRKI